VGWAKSLWVLEPQPAKENVNAHISPHSQITLMVIVTKRDGSLTSVIVIVCVPFVRYLANLAKGRNTSCSGKLIQFSEELC
jgi:hypothetical protein